MIFFRIWGCLITNICKDCRSITFAIGSKPRGVEKVQQLVELNPPIWPNEDGSLPGPQPGQRNSALDGSTVLVQWFGGFHKWEHPQIIHFNMMFRYKPTILGWCTPILGNPPFGASDLPSHDSWSVSRSLSGDPVLSIFSIPRPGRIVVCILVAWMQRHVKKGPLKYIGFPWPWVYPNSWMV